MEELLERFSCVDERGCNLVEELALNRSRDDFSIVTGRQSA